MSPRDRAPTPASQAADAASPPVDARQPWPGLASYSEETRANFHGREAEIAELARRVQRKTLTVLFGQSGLGKTSILRAGLVPRLRAEGYCAVYVRIDHSRDSPPPAQQIKDAVHRATAASGTWTQSGIASDDESLWEFLHHRDDTLRDADGRPLIPLLIFDQFEEIFTLGQSDDAGHARVDGFIRDLADLVENRPPQALEAAMEHDDTVAERFDFARSDYRVLIALREDYLAHLESLRPAMPSIAANRMRLARMTGEQALDAVLRPGAGLVSDEVAAAIVRFVAGGAELANAEVEPSLLSLICRELNNSRIAQAQREISTGLLAGTHAGILAEFYERAVGDQPPGVRRVIEDDLLTDGGFRESFAEERVLKSFAAAGAAPDALATLVNRRLLRVDERLDVRRVELTHDVLCSVVKASRDMRLEREAREAAELRLQQQRERDLATRRALVRARRIAAGCALLSVVAIASAGFGWFSMRRAQQTQGAAEQARGEAEKLIVYLLDDFRVELEPIGRLDIVGGLAKRALDYYSALPPALRSIDTERHRALAELQHAGAVRRQGQIELAGKELDDGIATLDRLSAGTGHGGELVTIGLAQGLGTRALLRTTNGDSTAALADSRRAIDVLKPLAEAQGASVAVRRNYAAAIERSGFITMRAGEVEAAEQPFEAARVIYRGIAKLGVDDLPALTGYLETSAWLIECKFRLGRSAEALTIGDEMRPLGEAALAKRPGDLSTTRAIALAESNLTEAAGDLLQWPAALEHSRRAAALWEAMLRADAENTISMHNLKVAKVGQAGALGNLGRLREAMAIEVALATEPESKGEDVTMAADRAMELFSMALRAADVGDRAAIDTVVAKAARLLVSDGPVVRNNAYVAAVTRTFERATPLAVEGLRGDRAHAVAGLQALVDALEPVQPPTAGDAWRRQIGLSELQRLLAHLALLDKNIPAAAAHSRQAASIAHSMDPHANNEFRWADAAVIERALALARLGREPEARVEIGPVLARKRALMALPHDDAQLHFETAQALYVAAEAGAGPRAAQLKEAAALISGLPAEMRGLRSVVFWQDLIQASLHHGQPPG